MWWEHKWGNWLDIPYACVCSTVGFVVDVWLVFSTVVGPILRPCIPVIAETVLGSRNITATTQSHVHHFGPFGYNGLVYKPNCCGVIGLDWAVWLWPPHIDEGLMEGYHLMCSDEQCSKFCLSCRGQDKLDDSHNG